MARYTNQLLLSVEKRALHGDKKEPANYFSDKQLQDAVITAIFA